MSQEKIFVEMAVVGESPEELLAELNRVKAMSLAEKMLCIQTEIETVAKNLKVVMSKGTDNNAEKSYQAVSEGDVLRAVKPFEFKYRVWSYPFTRKIAESQYLTSVNSYGKTVNQLFVRIETGYRAVNIDNPSEVYETVSFGDGLDSGDKASGKGITYSDKYALLKLYKIETGDDPDKEPSGELVNATKNPPKPEPVVEQSCTEQDAFELANLLTEDEVNMTFSYYKIKDLKQLTKKQADALLKKKRG